MTVADTSRAILIIVPAWNEQDSVGATVAEIRATNPTSTSSSSTTAPPTPRPSAPPRPGRSVCRLPFNLGVGGAMRAGYRYALRHGYDAAVQVDADGQHDPRYIAACSTALDRGRRRDRRPVRRRRRPLPGPRPAPLGHGPARAGAQPAGRHPPHRRHVGLPRGQPPGDRASSPPTTRPSTSATPSSRSSSPSARAARSRRCRSRCGRAPPAGERRPRAGPRSTSFRAVVALGLALVRRWPTGSPRSESDSWPLPRWPSMTAEHPGPGRRRHRDLVLFEMLRRHRLREKYALIWFVIAVGAALVAVFPALLVGGHRRCSASGAVQPAVLRRLAGAAHLTLQHSYELGRLEEQTRTLAEEVALLRLAWSSWTEGGPRGQRAPEPATPTRPRP